MTEQQLRALVREAIARHVGGPPPPPSRAAAPVHPSHPSHRLLLVPDGADADGPCVIEPAVMCNHCGYCKSYGH